MRAAFVAERRLPFRARRPFRAAREDSPRNRRGVPRSCWLAILRFLRPHTANKMLRLAISKRQMPYGTRMSIPPIPFALRCQGSCDPGPRVFNGQRRAVDFARCSLARPSRVIRRSERMHEGSRLWLPESRTSTRTMGPCLLGYPSSRPGLHSIRTRRGLAISRSRRNHPSVAPSRRDPCRLCRIGSRPMSVGSGKHRLFAEGPRSCSRRF